MKRKSKERKMLPQATNCGLKCVIGSLSLEVGFLGYMGACSEAYLETYRSGHCCMPPILQEAPLGTAHLSVTAHLSGFCESWKLQLH